MEVGVRVQVACSEEHTEMEGKMESSMESVRSCPIGSTEPARYLIHHRFCPYVELMSTACLHAKLHPSFIARQ